MSAPKINKEFKNFIENLVNEYSINDLFRENELDYSSFNKVKSTKLQKRDKSIKDNIIKSSKGYCHMNKKHITFPTNSQKNYLEAHHVLPLSYQDGFNKTLDDVENMVAICPNCHQAFHRSTSQNKLKLIDEIIDNGYSFSNRLNLIEAYGIGE